MKFFRYRALEPSGHITTGMIAHHKRHNVLSILKNDGLTPLWIKRDWWGEYRIKQTLQTDLMTFYQYLEQFSKLRLSLREALSTLTQHFTGPFQAIIKSLLTSLGQGHMLSESLALFPRVFDPVSLALIRMGEAAGQLDTACNAIQSYLIFQQKNQAELAKSLRYPLLVLLMLIGVCAGLWIFLIPHMVDLIHLLGDKLPWTTRSILMCGDIITSPSFPIILLSFGLLILGLGLVLRTPKGRIGLEKGLLSLPFIGPLLLQENLGRFFYIWHMTLQQKLDLLEALKLALQSLSLMTIKKQLAKVIPQILEGESVASCLGKTGLIDPPLVRIVQAGEETAQMVDALGKLSSFYETQSKSKRATLTEFLPPFALGMIGLLILWMISGTFIPLYDLICDMEIG